MAILSINSHVSCGLVGNAVGVFALQRLGIEVWPVHTTLFSNHPGLGPLQGEVVSPTTVRAQFRGLADIGVLGRCEAVMSGYLGDAGSADAVAEAVSLVKAANSEALYLCDPVIGDLEFGQYVSEEVREAIVRVLIPIADVATPNPFELAALAGMPPARSVASAKAAAKILPPPTVIATGLTIESGEIATLASTWEGTFAARTPRIGFDHRPDGVGDLFAAVLLGRYLQGRVWPDAVAAAVSACYGVLGVAEGGTGHVLPIVAAQSLIVSPECVFPARPA